ncbi:MAG: MinD/ParA family protein [Selenomonadaceae bacterium]|nr:MinD/ParA family protein [Selenomonadaceae bacterium]
MFDQASKLRDLVEERADEEAQARQIGELRFDMAETTRVIAITSGKGGVGKTNLAVNLAIGLQLAGQRVMVIDADIGMANVNLLMGSVANRSLVDLLSDDVQLEDVIEDGAAGVKYISGVAGVEAALNVNRLAQKKLHKKLGRCSEMADIIIIDTGAGLNRNVIEFVLAAEEVLLITTPEPTALADAYAVIKAYSTYTERRNIKLVVNRIRDEEECYEVTDKINQTTKNFLGVTVDCLGYIYEDKTVREAVQMQEPFLIVNPESAASRCITELAKSLLSGQKMESVSRGWRGFLDRLFGY